MTSDPLKRDSISKHSVQGTARRLLVIRLPAAKDGVVYWATEIDYGTTTVSKLSSLQSLSDNRRCKVLVPGELVGIHTLRSEGRMNHTRQQALTWELEEELATDVEDMHFAFLNHSDGQAHIAAVNKTYMQQWQEWLQESGINSQQWLPDTLALPFAEDECTVLQLEDMFLVRNGEWDASVCDSSWLPLYLESINSEFEDLRVRALSPLPDPEQPDVAPISSDSILLSLLETTTSSKVNLLQGEWQPESTLVRNLKPWRVAAGLLITTCLLMLGVTLAGTARLQSQSDELQAEAHAIYNELFPGERIVRLEFSLNQKLSALRQPDEGDESGLPALLDKLAPMFKVQPELKPVQLSYDHDRQVLRMTAESNSFSSFSRFRENAPEAVTVTVQTVEQQEEIVTGALVIRSDKP